MLMHVLSATRGEMTLDIEAPWQGTAWLLSALKADNLFVGRTERPHHPIYAPTPQGATKADA